MTDNRTTEKLRQMLDERGIEWSSPELRPNQTRLPYVKFEPWGEGTLKVTMFNLTPEQAIAATLWRGTCKHTRTFNLVKRECDGERYEWHGDELPKRCPNCGAEVTQ